ncbi:BC1872 family protein [Bacillus cereus]|uniref:BC1872 family protein n=1 Tax=Bacillus cereus TaxID=1396 RepID=UPI00397EBFA0
MFKKGDIVTMDAMVQKEVMGWKFYKPDFRPSTDMNDTWKVVEKLQEQGWSVLVRNCVSEFCGLIRSGEAQYGDYFCHISRDEYVGEGGFVQMKEKNSNKIIRKTAQEAICLSALMAMGVKLNTNKS